MRGTERVLQKLPLNFPLLLIVARKGRDYRPGPRSGQSRSPGRAARLPFAKKPTSASSLCSKLATA
jgi:hypothetical protein